MRGSSYRSPELLAWYEVRDTLLGANYLEQDIKKALQLSAACQHPNAVWLTKLFAGHDVRTPEEARQMFLGCEDDPRALCFAAVNSGVGEAMLRRAAARDCAYAQAMMAEKTGGEEMFRWARKSASQGERDGFYRLAICYKHRQGCELSMECEKRIICLLLSLGILVRCIIVGCCLTKLICNDLYGWAEQLRISVLLRF
jgi:TPR repeat protein